MSNMKCVLVWLAVMTTTFHTSQACWNDAHNNIRVIGLHTDTFIGGRIDICFDGSRIRAVCADGWDEHAAMVACRQLHPGTGYAAASCSNSCFGVRVGAGVSGFRCTGTEATLLQCAGITHQTSCVQHAGVLCYEDNSTSPVLPPPGDSTCNNTCPRPPSCEDCNRRCNSTSLPCADSNSTYPSTPQQQTSGPSTTMGTKTETPNGVRRAEPMVDSCSSLAALGGGLGGLCAILAILLVGVVMGWAWSCNRQIGKSGSQERVWTEPEETFPNPSNAITSHPDATPPAVYETIDITGQMERESGQGPDNI